MLTQSLMLNHTSYPVVTMGCRHHVMQVTVWKFFKANLNPTDQQCVVVAQHVQVKLAMDSYCLVCRSAQASLLAPTISSLIY